MSDDHDEDLDDGGQDEWMESIRPFLPADYDDLNPIEQLRAQHQAGNLVRRQEWLAEHGDDPDDPFTEDETAEVIWDTIDQRIAHLHRPGEDGSWMTVTYLMRPPIKLLRIEMGNGETHEPAVDLIITDDEAYELIDRIIAAIGPKRH